MPPYPISNAALKGGRLMGRRRKGLMSERLKYELAEELGVADLVRREGWGSVSSRDCGNLVRLAIERAERAMIQG
jgi:small acid-soluble spore protein F (minor alpha/beta-type SASP)